MCERSEDCARDKNEAAQVLVEILLEVEALAAADRAVEGRRFWGGRRLLRRKRTPAAGAVGDGLSCLEAEAPVAVGTEGIDVCHGGVILAETVPPAARVESIP